MADGRHKLSQSWRQFRRGIVLERQGWNAALEVRLRQRIRQCLGGIFLKRGERLGFCRSANVLFFWRRALERFKLHFFLGCLLFGRCRQFGFGIARPRSPASLAVSERRLVRSTNSVRSTWTGRGRQASDSRPSRVREPCRNGEDDKAQQYGEPCCRETIFWVSKRGRDETPIS